MTFPAVTEAGKAGDSLAQDFFREEYILNNTIGMFSHFLLPVFWFDEQIYLFIIYLTFFRYISETLCGPNWWNYHGRSKYLKLSSCCTSTPADGAVCSDLAECVIKRVQRQCGPACLRVYKINKNEWMTKCPALYKAIHIAVPLFSLWICAKQLDSHCHWFLATSRTAY